jgi:hypothetical protein
MQDWLGRRLGLVTPRECYRSVFLTDEGRWLAEECRRRHDIVMHFLLRLGLDPERRSRTPKALSITSAPARSPSSRHLPKATARSDLELNRIPPARSPT